MADCELRLHDLDGALLASHPVSCAAERLDDVALRRAERAHLSPVPSTLACASLENGAGPCAVFVPEDGLEPGMHRMPGFIAGAGRWVTTAVELDGAGRVYHGPGVFFRASDVREPPASLADALAAMPAAAPRERTIRQERIFEWRMDGQRFLYVVRQGRWGLWGAGNSSDVRVESVLRDEGPANASALLWAIGALPLVSPAATST